MRAKSINEDYEEYGLDSKKMRKSNRPFIDILKEFDIDAKFEDSYGGNPGKELRLYDPGNEDHSRVSELQIFYYTKEEAEDEWGEPEDWGWYMADRDGREIVNGVKSFNELLKEILKVKFATTDLSKNILELEERLKKLKKAQNIFTG